jgi:[protein-PII] uridylyltransferase
VGSPRLHVDVSREWNTVLAERTARVDNAVIELARQFLDACGPAAVTLAAVGGYGRRELFPASDIDLLILARSEDELQQLKAPLTDFLRRLWDSGLRISQSARTVSECCQLNEQNIELHISLLDLRFLAGDEALFANLSASLESFYEKQRHTLTRRLAEMTRGRHAKYNDTIFHLEPNIKETPGGIRDMHFLHWLNRLAPHNEALIETVTEADPARSVLFPIRIFLHERSGRDNNLLSFDLQDEAAASIGVGVDPAEWMRVYFQSARKTWQAARRALDFTDSLDRSLLRQIRDRRSRLSTTDYTISHDRIFLRNPAEVVHGSTSLFRLFGFSARHGIVLSWDTKRRLRAQSGEIAVRLADSPPNWNDWSEILSQPQASVALHEMQETGVLAAALPEWQAIDSLVVRDFYHRYTVDEHTLQAVGVIDDLAAAAPETSKRFQQLAAEVDEAAVLRFALLLHDIGKGTEPGEHVRGSIEVARAAAHRFNIPEHHRKTIEFLIDHHLDLSMVMNSRDLDDPATARQLASQTQTAEQLRYLTLLTFADISAVNPTAMTPWRLEQLWRVYTIAEHQLTRQLDTDRIHGASDFSLDDRTPELAYFLEGLPTRYIRTHSKDEIQRHVQLEGIAREKKVAIDIVPHRGVFQATILAQDRPGLFAALCGTLASFGLNIVKAEAFNNQSGLVVDQLRFTDPLRNLELNPTEVDRLRRTLERVVLEIDDVATLLKRRRPSRRPARVAQIAPQVRFNNDASETATLVDFIAEDRPGLLYDLASVFAAAECNIEIVLIDTEAHKAIDVFYVTHRAMKLDEALQGQLQVSLVRAAETGQTRG